MKTKGGMVVKNFIEQLADNETSVEELDDFIDLWHNEPHGVSLHEFLGLTFDEYGVVIFEPTAFKFILSAREANETTVFPEVIDCSCGKDHLTVPRIDVGTDDEGVELLADAVCRIHKRHEPCRPCLRESRKLRSHTS